LVDLASAFAVGGGARRSGGKLSFTYDSLGRQTETMFTRSYPGKGPVPQNKFMEDLKRRAGKAFEKEFGE